jgi:Calcineurin-like phosphoesterase
VLDCFKITAAPAHTGGVRSKTGLSGLGAVLVVAGCGSVALLGQQDGTSSSGSGGAAGACTPCVTDQSCAAGELCGQFAGDTYCAPDCTNGQACSSDRACTMLTTAQGQTAQLCVPRTNVCGGAATSSSSSASSSSGSAEICGTLDGPDIPAPCMQCVNDEPCQANGCYGGYWCNVDSVQCQPPPSPSSCTTSSSDGGSCAHAICATGAKLVSGCDPCATKVCGSDSYCCDTQWDSQCVNEVTSICNDACSGSSTSSSSSSSTGSSSSSGGLAPAGGTLPVLSFAIVGDTRPANEDDPGGFPTTIITKIWQDVEAYSPRPAFAVTTGDYMFASPSHTPPTQAAQLELYMTARVAFSNVVFPAMGNHECDGATADNCGPGTTSCCGSGCYESNNASFDAFVQKLLAPINQTLPYYTININGPNHAWTAKLVFVACNYWSDTQATWLEAELSQPTTYTFVVRHEGSDATTAPCLCGTPNAATIMGQHPYTLLIAGHTHTFEYFASEKQVIVGNGGAPLSGSVDYGYVIAEQQSNGDMLFKALDYSTGAELPGGPFTVPP